MKINIGDNIRTLRVLKGFSQEYMANELEISVSAYSNIERDVSALTVNRLIDIAGILSVKPSFILEMDNKQILSETDDKEYVPKSIESEFEKLKKQFELMSSQFQKITNTPKKPATKTKKR